MGAQFNEILSMLRHEKEISQRCAASDLGVSQALLSHYENGIREPGMAFVIKACKYYGVSANFLLGIDAVRGGDSHAGAIIESMEIDSNPSIQLFAGSVSLILKILGKLGSEDLTTEALRFIGTSVYLVFRQIISLKEDIDIPLKVPEDRFFEASSIESIHAGLRFKDELTKLANNLSLMSINQKYMETDFPILCNQLSDMLQTIDDRIAKHVYKET